MRNLSRRNFIKESSRAVGVLAIAPGTVYAENVSARTAFAGGREHAITLALFSLNRSFDSGAVTLLDIPKLCREEFKIDGIEYVTKYFPDVRDYFIKELNQRVADFGLSNELIMVDREGDMVSKDKKERMRSALNHRKWVHIAAHLGCHSIRCNATGTANTVQEDPGALERAIESFSSLLEYAKEFNINILVENHGDGLAADANWLNFLVEELNTPQFGLLPDFGNYNVDWKDSTTLHNAIRTNLPHAKGVSVKARWKRNGEYYSYDVGKCVQVAKVAGFAGKWGIESMVYHSDGYRNNLSAEEAKDLDFKGVRWTKSIIEKEIYD